MQDLEPPLLSPAQSFTSSFSKRVTWVNSMIVNPPNKTNDEYGKLMYIEMIKSIVSAMVYGDREMTAQAALSVPKINLVGFDEKLRESGNDWTYLGDTSKSSLFENNNRSILA